MSPSESEKDIDAPSASAGPPRDVDVEGKGAVDRDVDREGSEGRSFPWAQKLLSWGVEARGKYKCLSLVTRILIHN